MTRRTDDGNDAAASLLIKAKEGVCPWCCFNEDIDDAGLYHTEAECLSVKTVRSHNGLASNGICTTTAATTTAKAIAAAITHSNGDWCSDYTSACACLAATNATSRVSCPVSSRNCATSA